MSSQANDQGWILHSLAQSRRFGPMTEDELRGYFRAGMVKSVDRLTAPGESAMRTAAEVAAMLGVAVPAGPPPPELSESPTPPLPSMAARVARDPASEERAARAAAALNIDVAALMASSGPEQRRSVWLLPAVAVVLMVVALVIALNMLRKMKVPAAQSPGATAAQATQPVVYEDASAIVEPKAEVAAGPQAVVAVTSPDPDFDARMARAEAMRDARDWAGLVSFAQEWAQSRPESNEPLQYLGIAYSGLGDYRQAAEPLQKVVAREPANKQARSLLADAYLQSERSADAAALYKQMVNEAPRDARLWNNYGAALNAAGQQEQALAAMETAVRMDPGFKQAWTNLGNLYQSRGDTARATAAFANAR